MALTPFIWLTFSRINEAICFRFSRIAKELLNATYVSAKLKNENVNGIFTEGSFKGNKASGFIQSIPMRFYEREDEGDIPA